jgi:hypothetical protein
MRTTVTLEKDVAAAVRLLQRERSIGVSEAVNELIRKGLIEPKRPRKAFKQRSYPIGMQIDVTDVAEAIEILEGPGWR